LARYLKGDEATRQEVKYLSAQFVECRDLLAVFTAMPRGEAAPTVHVHNVKREGLIVVTPMHGKLSHIWIQVLWRDLDTSLALHESLRYPLVNKKGA
jgi:hypothetical protein